MYGGGALFEGDCCTSCMQVCPILESISYASVFPATGNGDDDVFVGTTFC